ncbi:MAG: hypothetical protein WC256_06015 [Desulfurivibrionaceae bacterium]
MSEAAIAFFFDLNIPWGLGTLNKVACVWQRLAQEEQEKLLFIFLSERRRFMGNMKNLWLRGVKIVSVLVCVVVLTGIVGCASQAGESPKKSGGGCFSLLQLFS